MISLIICSRSKQVLAQVEESVKASVGVPFEIIAIDNSQNKYGICNAYNIGAAQAKYDYLCFMHEDLSFYTQSWGQIVIDILAKPEVGVLGVAGCIHQVKAPVGWIGAGRMYLGINVIHTARNETQHDYLNPMGKEPLVAAATLDGLWLCCRKSVWKEFNFDALTFPGFHFYDIDFCTRVATKYKNYITFEVLIEHFSHGTFDSVWMKNALEFYKHLKNYLPFGSVALTKAERSSLDLLAMQQCVIRLIESNFPPKDILFCLKECFKLSPFSRDNLYLIKVLLKNFK